MCAFEPIHKKDLLTHLDAENNASESSTEIDEDLILELCNNLLVIDSVQQVWRFSHLSVTEYLEDNHTHLRYAHCGAAKVCLQFLIKAYQSPIAQLEGGRTMGEHISERPTQGLMYSFEDYARNYWPAHVKFYDQQVAKCRPDPDLTCLLKRFFGSVSNSSLQYRVWYDRIIPSDFFNHSTARPTNFEYFRATRSNLKDELSPNNIPVFAMASFSISFLLRDWWETEVDLSQTNSQAHNLLVLAAAAGCTSVCELLLRRGLDVNMQLQGDRYPSALSAAAEHDRTETIELLIDRGAEVNMVLRSGSCGSALATAARYGSTNAIELLIERGADVNMVLQSGSCGSALAAAARYGDTKTIELLIKRGADVNMVLQNGDYGSVITAAAATVYGNVKVIKFLIERGVEVLKAAAIGVHSLD